MASQDTKSDVFKFVSLRPPSPPSGDSATINFITDGRTATETPVGRFVAQFNAQNAGTFPDKLKAFIADKKYTLTYPQDGGDKTFDKVLAAATAIPAGSISAATLKTAIESATGQTLDALVTSPAAVKRRDTLWDCFYAFYLLSGLEGQDLTSLTSNLRTVHLLTLLKQGQAVPGDATLRAILSATPIIDKIFTSLPKPAVPAPPSNDVPLPEETKRAYQKIWNDLLATHQAILDAQNLPVAATTEKSTVKVPAATAAAITRRSSAATSTPAKAANRTTVNIKMAVDSAAYNALSKETLAAFKAARITPTTFSRPEAIAKLTTGLTSLYANLGSITDPRVLDYMPPAAANLAGVQPLVERFNRLTFQPHFILPFPLPNDNVRGEIRPLGIGDLKVVKQKLVSYQLGEVAHIENVLRGESKERKYRVLDRTEQTLDVTTETTEEQTRDTQTTERFELKKESENTIQQQMSVQAGVTVSGSYGMVTFGAHGDFAYSTSSQDSTKTSSNFAREVVDKSVTRIQKNVRQEQITKQLHEVEELDTHGLDNSKQPDNLTGVYRWVDKYYEAQIYNYGKRMMFEFIVPEPAAFYGYAQTHQPKAAITPPPPLPANLTHKNITESNFQGFIRDYQIQGCTPPPPQSKVVSATLSSDAKIDDGTPLSKSSKDLVVPDGYYCDSLAVSLSFVHAAYPQFRLSVGVDNYWYSYTTTGGSGREKIDYAGGTTGTFDSIIPISIDIYDVNSYFVNVVASCLRTDDSYELWQIHTFEKIMASYQALKATYDQQVAQQQTQQGVAIHGQNPGINRQIEKGELKKACVKLLMDTWQFGAFSAMKQVGDNPPDFEIHQAVAEGKISQFFEQAFEWENLTYLFYPYFWGRQSQWILKLNTYDEDPLFTQFLQAGAARVVMPVHPAYNDAVMYFLENNGAIWNGGSPPRLNDPMYISLADELRGQSDDLANAVAEGDPWQVVLPTTLVYLQKDSTLPTFP